MKYAYFNGKFVEMNKAVIPITTHALHYGTGCFEGIRAYWQKDFKQLAVFRIKAHYQRLANSCRTLFMQLPCSAKQLEIITLELLRKNKYQEDVYIRPLVYKASPAIAKFDLTELENGFAIYCLPFGRYLDVSKGVSVCLSSWRRGESNVIPPAAKPTGLYINTALAKTEALKNRFDEAILLNQDGSVSEGSAMNLFLVSDNHLITPDKASNILVGVTRQTVIEIAREELGIETVERRVGRNELYTSKEVFFTGTAAEITPVVKIDHRKIGRGKAGLLTKKLQAIFTEIVRGKNKKYQDWLTSV